MTHHLAQVNIAKFRTPIGDPVNAEFIASLERVNLLAETQPGYVWRLVGDGANALDVKAFDDPDMAINMSVWTDMDALAAWVYRNEEHRAIMRRRREWFDAMDVYLALWWVPIGHTPTPEEAKAKLDLMARLGPTAEAFTFKHPFPMPGAGSIAPILDKCA
ncbi:MAG: DUF3291 domain-containing protein [Pseudomonadota bacterium]